MQGMKGIRSKPEERMTPGAPTIYLVERLPPEEESLASLHC
jgi:hypothetical protein